MAAAKAGDEGACAIDLLLACTDSTMHAGVMQPASVASVQVASVSEGARLSDGTL